MHDTKARYMLIGALMVLAAAIGWFWKGEDAVVSVSPKAKVQFWMDKIDTMGTKDAYAEFVAQTEKLAQPEQHSQAHIFGEALYRQGGIGALSTCDNRFSWGCFHQFIGVALSEQGTGVVDELRSACFGTVAKLSLSPDICVHSLGHGLLAYSGYTREGLDEALDLCDSVPNNNKRDPMKECYWGALMEYNVRLMLADEPRHVSGGSLYSPCDELSGDRQMTCFRSQSQWWDHLYKYTYDSDQALYAHMGDLCSALTVDNQKNACFEGIGLAAAWDLGLSGEARKKLCEASSPEPQDQLHCKSYLAYWLWVIWHGQGINKQYTDPVCAGLTGEAFDRCSSFAHGKPI